MNQAPSTDNWALYRLLCQTLAGRPLAQAQRAQLPELLQLARDYLVEPALACRLASDTGFEPDPGLAQRLKEPLLLNTRRNMLILAQSLRVAAQLNRAGIQPLFLKGAARLLCSEGEAIGFRRQADIDLLLRPDELQRGCTALLDAGYRFMEIPGARTPESAAEAMRLGRVHHHLRPLVHDQYGASIELHRLPLPRRFASIAGEAWWQQAQQHEQRGAQFLVPGLEHRALMLALGAFVNDGDYARFRLSPRLLEDYLWLRSEFATRDRPPDLALLQRHGGAALAQLDGVVARLAPQAATPTLLPTTDVSMRLRLMRARFDSPGLAWLLDRQARARHLASALRHAGGKLPAYLRRLVAQH